MSIDVKNLHFMAYFEALMFEPGRVSGLLTMDLCSNRPELLIDQELKPKLNL